MHELGFIDETRINVYQRPDQESTEEGKGDGDGISYHYSNRLNEEVKERASEGQGLPIREGVVYLHTKSPHPYPVHSICQSLVSSAYPTDGTHAVLAIQTDPFFWSIYGKFKGAAKEKRFSRSSEVLETRVNRPFALLFPM
ncbi:hypothetical protein PO909_026367 [Leuciscus waleckii]